MNPTVTLLLGVANAAMPGIIALVADIKALFKKYPAMTPEQIAAVVKELTGSSDAAFDAFIAEVQSDQAAHGTSPTP